MKFLQQLAPQLPVHETAIAEKVDESSVIRTLDNLRRYTARDIADYAFFHFLILFILRNDFDGQVAAKGHAARTIVNTDFKKFTLVGTDLYMYLHILFGGEQDRLKKNPANAIFFSHMHLSPRDVKSELLDISLTHRNTAKETRFLLSLEKNLQIDNANYRSCRRIVQNWNSETTHNQRLCVTRLLQAMRLRCPQSDLLVHLENFARNKVKEIPDARNAELMEAEQLNELFQGKPIALGKSDFGIGGKFTVGEHEYFIEFEDYGENGKYEVIYGRTDTTIKFKPTGDTSTGDAIKVLSIVVATIEVFVKEYQPNTLFFTGNAKGGLASLYTRMVEKLKGKLEADGFEFEASSNKGNAIFAFKRKA